MPSETVTTAPNPTRDRPASPPSGNNRRALLAAALGIPLLGALLLTAFAWPTSNIAPRDLPIGITGPAPAIAAIEAELAARDGAFAVAEYSDAEAAETAIRDRDIYGAIAVGPDGAQVLTASAAGPVVAQLLGELARGIEAAQGSPVEVRDVVAADADDPRGAALGAGVLPLIILGIAIGVISTLLATGGLVRLAVVAVGALTAALGGIALLQAWLGILGGDWWLNAGVLMLTIGAIGMTVAGLGALFGEVGIALGAMTMVLLGNPLSGLTSAPELLPQPWGEVGQALPPGAGGSLLRSTAFFDGAGATGPLWTLLAWFLGGLVLLAASWFRTRSRGSLQTSRAG